MMPPPFRTLTIITMAKRALSSTLRSPSPVAKKSRTDTAVVQNKIATAEAAARVDADPPLTKLTALLDKGFKPAQKGDAVVYWMRMEDMRSNLLSASRP